MTSLTLLGVVIYHSDYGGHQVAKVPLELIQHG